MARSEEEVRILVTAKDEASKTLDKVADSMGDVTRPAAKMNKVMGGLGATLKGVGLAAGAAALGGMAAMGAGLAKFVTTGLDTNNTFEQIEARLNAFNKDAKVTADQIELIRKEAARTPFALDEMASAFAAMQGSAKSAGLDMMDLLHTAEILAASNPLEGLEGASFALKEAITGDFTSIIERFNLSRSSITQWKKDGVSNIEIVRRAMAEMGLDMDLVAAQANTLDGRMSTLNDSFSTFAATVTKPLFDKLSESAGTLNDELTAAQPSIDAFAALLATDLQNAITWLTGESGLPSVESVVAGLTTAWNTGRDALVTFVQALSGDWQDRADKIEPLDRVFGNLALIVKDLTAALGVLWTTVSAGDDPLTTTNENVVTLADSLGAIHEVTQTWAQSITDVNDTLQPAADLINGLQLEVQWLADAIRDEAIVTWDAWSAAIETAIGWIQDAIAAFKALGRVIVPIPSASSGTGGGPSTFGPMALGAPTAGVVSGIPVTPSFSMVPRRPIGDVPQRGVIVAPPVVINVDARGARDPVEVERAGYRGARRALEEAARERVGRRSVQRLRTALDRRARIR